MQASENLGWGVFCQGLPREGSIGFYRTSVSLFDLGSPFPQRGPACGCTNIRATSLYSVGQRPDPASSEAGGPILHNGIKAAVLAGTPPPRTVIGDPSQSVRTGPKPSAFP
jgi:hypothetical protein